MIALGNWGGVYMIGGGVEMAIMGWLVHPWGLTRWKRQRQQLAT